MPSIRLIRAGEAGYFLTQGTSAFLSNSDLSCAEGSRAGRRTPGGVSSEQGRGAEHPPSRCAHAAGDAGQTWSCWSRARGGRSNDLRAGTPLLGGKAGRAGAAQPGEEKAAGRP